MEGYPNPFVELPSRPISLPATRGRTAATTSTSSRRRSCSPFRAGTDSKRDQLAIAYGRPVAVHVDWSSEFAELPALKTRRRRSRRRIDSPWDPNGRSTHTTSDSRDGSPSASPASVFATPCWTRACRRIIRPRRSQLPRTRDLRDVRSVGRRRARRVGPPTRRERWRLLVPPHHPNPDCGWPVNVASSATWS